MKTTYKNGWEDSDNSSELFQDGKSVALVWESIKKDRWWVSVDSHDGNEPVFDTASSQDLAKLLVDKELNK